MDSREVLKRLTEQSAQRFESENLVRSFREYLDQFLEHPDRSGRIAARYLADCFDHYGTSEVRGIGGSKTRWNLFDAPFDEGRDKLIGQEEVQREFYQALSSFAREGRVDKLVLLHGPNGSAKTTFFDLVFRALEDYSRQPEGQIHCFSWIFPTRDVLGKRLGFSEERQRSNAKSESYAYLAQEEIAASIPCELRDPPIFLLPPELRAELLPKEWSEPSRRRAHRYLLEGELCAKCKKIFDGLLRSNRGNLLEVLKHVQVERYFISQRYRSSAVRISPQTHVDATEVQITADRSAASLPVTLQDMNLFVPVGDLVDGNRGLVEFSDFLKRPVEMNKYLLTTCERGIIMLPSSIAHLNTVLVATSNEQYLDEMKTTALFTSFNARLELVAVPYLLEVSKEERIYDELLDTISRHKHVAPHVAKIAATWAVLCRLHKPEPDEYPTEMRPLVRDLRPLEKVALYDGAGAPSRLEADARQELLAAVSAFHDEYRGHIQYEGRYGPSARELRTMLMDCRHDQASSCVSPTALFKQLSKLVKDKSVHLFLRMEPDNGYHDPEAFIETVKEMYLDIVDAELRDAMQLVPIGEYERRFERYVQELGLRQKKERVKNEVTGKFEELDTSFLETVEESIAPDTDADTFREAVLGKIAAFRIDHRDDDLDLPRLFPEAFAAMRASYHAKHAGTIEAVQANALRYGTEDLDDLDADLKKRVETTMETMISRHGYCEACAKEAMAFLRRER